MKKPHRLIAASIQIAYGLLFITQSTSAEPWVQVDYEQPAAELTAPSLHATNGFDVAAELYRQKDYRTAFQAFVDLAKQGDPRAQTVSALMLKFGEGTEQDLPEAFRWYWAAAQQSFPAAQYHVGEMLAEGIGVAPDQQRAIKWLTLAAENGFSRAIDKLAELNASAGVLEGSQSKPTAWKQNWDLKLPTELLLEEFEQPAIKPDQPYLVQVGAMDTRASANQLWNVLTEQHQNLFRNRTPIIDTALSSGRRIYVIQTGPFPDFKSADDFCGRLMASTVQAGCVPLKPK